MRVRDIHAIAEKKVRSKKRFYRHFAVYAAAMFLIFSINILDGPWYDFWALWPFVTWGSVILLQYLLVFGFPISGALSEEWEQKEMRKELYKLDPRYPFDDEDHRDLSLADRLELKELDRLKKKWEDDQFV